MLTDDQRRRLTARYNVVQAQIDGLRAENTALQADIQDQINEAAAYMVAGTGASKLEEKVAIFGVSVSAPTGLTPLPASYTFPDHSTWPYLDVFNVAVSFTGSGTVTGPWGDTQRVIASDQTQIAKNNRTLLDLAAEKQAILDAFAAP